MNVLDKIKIVQKGLDCCSAICECSKCPYDKQDRCRDALLTETNNVIDALQAELKKKTNDLRTEKPEFLSLTTGIVKHSDNYAIWCETSSVAVRVDDILTVREYKAGCGSEIWFKSRPDLIIIVQESIEDILEMIAEGE